MTPEALAKAATEALDSWYGRVSWRGGPAEITRQSEMEAAILAALRAIEADGWKVTHREADNIARKLGQTTMRIGQAQVTWMAMHDKAPGIGGWE